MEVLSDTYKNFWQMIIRPPRDVYDLAELGPAKFKMGGKPFERRDLQLRNDRNLTLECSHFVPLLVGKGKVQEPIPCVIYLHCNSSSRLEACDVLPYLLPRGISVFSLDLSGSGRSGGEYISLGYYEQLDVQVAVEHLRKSGLVSHVGLWGRSMGAATTVFAAAQDRNLAACVMDSPFSSFPLVAEELIGSGALVLPGFVLRLALRVIRGEIKTRAQFDIKDLTPIDKARSAKVPAIFCTGEEDKLVQPHHSKALHDSWGCPDRELVTFPGGHDGQRPEWFMIKAAEFFESRFEDAKAGRRRYEEPSAEQLSAIEAGAAGRASSSTTAATPSSPEAPRSERASQLTAELRSMGFDEDAVAEAVRRHSSIEAAVEWIMGLNAQAAEVLSSQFDLRAPDTRRNLDGVAEAEPRARSKEELAGSIKKALIELGFSEAKASAATQRCSSVEAAVEWLAAHSD